MAEAILLHKLGADSADQVDSAGIGGWHAGEEPDRRTRVELTANGIAWASRARKVTEEDFAAFDHLVALDSEIRGDLLALPAADPAKVSLLMDWCGEEGESVPDPYYGGQPGFRLVYEMCDRACEAIAREVFGWRPEIRSASGGN
jgi:protein-tyrosine phosphatase